MAEGPAFVEHHRRASRGRTALALGSIALLTAAVVLHLVMLAYDPWEAQRPLDRLWTLVVAPMLAVLAALQAWQLVAAFRAASRNRILYRLDADGAYAFPLAGRSRSIPRDALQKVQRAKNALLLMGRGPDGHRAGFVLAFPDARRDEVLTVFRHYWPDLSTTFERP